MALFSETRIIIKSKSELDIMRKGGRFLADILTVLKNTVHPGMSTWDLEMMARKMLRERNLRGSFLGYRGFPAVLCTSINEEVVHGIPSKKRILKTGDLLKIDMGVFYRGFHVDSALTIPIGEVDALSEKLIETGRNSLEASINMCRKGKRLGDVCYAVQEVAESAGFSVVTEYTGHGVGRQLHESPQIPNVGKAGTGVRLRNGMVFALEPMLNAGLSNTRVLSDSWTVVTADGKRSSHCEHTVAVTKDGPEVLTRREDEDV